LACRIDLAHRHEVSRVVATIRGAHGAFERSVRFATPSVGTLSHPSPSAIERDRSWVPIVGSGGEDTDGLVLLQSRSSAAATNHMSPPSYATGAPGFCRGLVQYQMAARIRAGINHVPMPVPIAYPTSRPVDWARTFRIVHPTMTTVHATMTHVIGLQRPPGFGFVHSTGG
jgi:hypothetical protein